MINKKIAYLIYAIVIMAIAGGVIKYEIDNQTPQIIDKVGHDNLEDPNQIPFGGDFMLQRIQQGTQTTAPFNLSSLRGKFVLLYFGYSYCPDICPQGLNNISQMLKELKRDRDKVVPIFITVDPLRDTAETLNLYAMNFDPSFIYLWGTEKEIEEVKNQYRVYAEKADGTTQKKPAANARNYVINHSSYIYILGPDGKFIQQMSHDLPYDEMTKIMVRLLAERVKADPAPRELPSTTQQAEGVK